MTGAERNSITIMTHQELSFPDSSFLYRWTAEKNLRQGQDTEDSVFLLKNNDLTLYFSDLV